MCSVWLILFVYYIGISYFYTHAKKMSIIRNVEIKFSILKLFMAFKNKTIYQYIFIEIICQIVINILLLV